MFLIIAIPSFVPMVQRVILVVLAAWVACFKVSEALPNHLWRRATPISSLSQVADSYGYVIVGGGSSGLTVADRLTEDPTSEFVGRITLFNRHTDSVETVLVVEYGTVIDNDTTLQMPSKGNPFQTQYMYVRRCHLGNRMLTNPQV